MSFLEGKRIKLVRFYCVNNFEKCKTYTAAEIWYTGGILKVTDEEEVNFIRKTLAQARKLFSDEAICKSDCDYEYLAYKLRTELGW